MNSKMRGMRHNLKTAIEAVRHGLPQALYIEGHNPLTLLHSALSEGLHELPDDECLKMAADIRLVITEPGRSA